MNKTHFYCIELVHSKDESPVWNAILNKVFLNANFIEFSYDQKSFKREGDYLYFQQIDDIIKNNEHLSVIDSKFTLPFAAKENSIRIKMTDNIKKIMFEIDNVSAWFFSDYTNPSFYLDHSLILYCNVSDCVLFLRTDICDQELFDIIQDSQLSEVVCNGENVELEKMIVSKY